MLEQPTLVERLAFGRPIDPSDDVTTHVAPRPTWALLARLLIAPMFLAAGVPKLMDTATTAAAMESKGIPAAFALAILAGLLEVVGALAILFGVVTRVAALCLFLFLIPVTLIFHDFWNLSGMEAQMQLGKFLQNLGTMGGLALLVAHGAGRYSIDARIRRPVEA
jgi:putative oxidoreductase